MPIGPRRSAFTVTAASLLACLAVTRPAQAQIPGTAGTTGTTTTASLADGDIFIGIQQQEGSNLSTFDLARFFNKANCDCNVPVYVFFTLTASGFAKRSQVPTGTVSFFVGTSCGTQFLQTACKPLGQVTTANVGDATSPSSEQITTFMSLGRETIKSSAQIISTPTAAVTIGPDGGVATTTPTSTGLCTSPTNGFTQTVWAVFDYGADGTPDFAAQQAIFVDLVPPPAPTGVTVAPGNEAVTVRWTPVDETLNPDLQGYQILCQRGGGLQVFADNTFTPYVKSCTSMATGVAALDPKFICSPLLNRSDAAYRVKILQNDIFYGATVVAIDNSGNASAPDPQFAQPAKTDSFFDVYRDGNQTNGGAGQKATPGAATGGFCAIAGESRLGRWGAGAAATALLAALLFRARRRRRR
ncbi:MAG TPA: hypothetical protein VMT47_04960 [Polyangia bacterium]|nr:hypothetical protein [Polyangia bacterium]